MSKQLQEEIKKRKDDKEKKLQESLKPYLEKYSSKAEEMLENAFDYFASLGEYKTYLQHVIYNVPTDVPSDEEEVFYNVLSEINFNNKERYGFFVKFKKGKFLSFSKISISTYYTESWNTILF